MSTTGPSVRTAETARRAGQSIYEYALDVLLTGVAVILPIVVTVYVLDAALGIITSALEPFIRVLAFLGVISGVKQLPVVGFLLASNVIESGVGFVSELIAFLVLTALVVGVGVVARNEYGEQLIDYFDYLVTAIPGVGTVYKSFRRMGDTMLESEVDNFRSVKLVEFPRDGAFVIGFETARPPVSVRRSAGSEEMVTLFLPLAPNPVMGGFLAHLPEDRVRDLDMTVEEGVRSIITSGIATAEPDEGLSREELQEVGVAEANLPDETAVATGPDADGTPDREVDGPDSDPGNAPPGDQPEPGGEDP